MWTTKAENRMPACLVRLVEQLAERLDINNGQVFQLSVEDLEEQVLAPSYSDALKSCFQEMLVDIGDIRYFLGLQDKLSLAN